MTKNKMSPLGYAVTAFLLFPPLLVLALVVAVLMWPVVPFLVYAASKPQRENLGSFKLPCDDPANCGCEGFEPFPRPSAAD